ncbi:MAG: glutathione S-transferase family protein [Hyphomicrobiaceae bacterium]
MAQLKVWGRNNSINVQKVMWTLAELGVAHERVDAGLAFGVVSEPWFGELNPNRTVPVLDDDVLILWESNVIVRYLAAKHASGTLIPSDPAARAETEMWMDWQQTTIMPSLGPVFLGLIRTPPEQRDQAVIDRGAENVRKVMAILDDRLSSREFVMGNALTAADIPLGCVTYRWFGLPVEHGALPHVRAWYERLVARPGFAEHVMMPLT